MIDSHTDNQTEREQPEQPESDNVKEPDTTAQEQSETAESDDTYSFMQERIKRKPVNWRKVFCWIGKHLAGGAVIGVSACLVFYTLAPWAKETLGIGDTVVTIPEDQPVVSETLPTDEETPEPQTLTIDSYQQLYTSLNSVVGAANKSIVTVTGVVNSDDWFDSTHASSSSVSGVIVAETQDAILILAPSAVSDNVSSLSITLNSGGSYNAAVKMRDRNTGLGVFSIPRSDVITSETDVYSIATLGNSYALRDGSPVILIGSPFGTEGAQAYGIVSSMTQEAGFSDGNITMLTSDVGSAYNSSGVFLNMSGEVVGIILPGINSNGGAVNALSISGIKNVIEKLLNGTPVPYMGIRGVDVDKSTAEAKGLTEGIYVTRVDVDSPAMSGGIQSGDIITNVDGQSIVTMLALRSTVMNHGIGNEVTVKGKRLGVDGYTDITFTVTIGSLQ